MSKTEDKKPEETPTVLTPEEATATEGNETVIQTNPPVVVEDKPPEGVEAEKAAESPIMEKLNQLEKSLKPEEPETPDEETQKAAALADFSKMSELVQKQEAQISQLETVVGKMSSVIETIIDRVKAVEAEPAQPKTMHTYAVVEQPTSKADNSAKVKRMDEIDTRLDELKEIRESNLEKFQADFVGEAQKLMDEKAALIRQ